MAKEPKRYAVPVRAKEDGEYRGPKKKGQEFNYVLEEGTNLPWWMEPLKELPPGSQETPTPEALKAARRNAFVPMSQLAGQAVRPKRGGPKVTVQPENEQKAALLAQIADCATIGELEALVPTDHPDDEVIAAAVAKAEALRGANPSV